MRELKVNKKLKRKLSGTDIKTQENGHRQK